MLVGHTMDRVRVLREQAAGIRGMLADLAVQFDRDARLLDEEADTVERFLTTAKLRAHVCVEPGCFAPLDRGVGRWCVNHRQDD